MGTIQIKKYERKVLVGKKNEQRQQVQKTYGKIIYRGTLSLNDMAEHIMKHGTVYTEDVVIGVITKLKSCMQEMLADGYKVKLDGIGTLYPTLTSEGVDDAKDFSAQENIVRVGVSFLADQSRKSQYKASAMKQNTTLSTRLYNELTGEDEEGTTPNPTPSGGGGENQNGENQNSQNGGNNNGDNNGETPSSVAAPTISGASPFALQTEVTLSAASGAAIHYTTDGSVPTSESQTYSTPFTLTSTTVVKAIAIKNGVSSDVASKTFTKSSSNDD